MTPSLFILFFISSVSYLFVENVNAVTCFGFAGTAYPDNVICPGSQACCGVNATCLSNRLCHNPGQNNSTFVRGPCAVSPYDPNTCAEICLYNETTGFLPRATICEDGRYCCDDLPNCCEAHEGVFLDNTGDIVITLPISNSITSLASSPTLSPSSTTSSPTSDSSTQTNGSSAKTSAADSSASSSTITSSSSGLSSGAKVGLGVGISVGAIVLIGLAIIIWYQRQRLKAVATAIPPEGHIPTTQIYTHPYTVEQNSYLDHQVHSQEMDNYQVIVPAVELPGSTKRK
ncbi:hypothetical protein EG329_010070 [Mollisiaceae sp. DMI_Dod_QoI]|nr:hypothetical protein EG329_010070 [Helotiales sp. DMI_Dod_QoI]